MNRRVAATAVPLLIGTAAGVGLLTWANAGTPTSPADPPGVEESGATGTPSSVTVPSGGTRFVAPEESVPSVSPGPTASPTSGTSGGTSSTSDGSGGDGSSGEPDSGSPPTEKQPPGLVDNPGKPDPPGQEPD